MRQAQDANSEAEWVLCAGSNRRCEAGSIVRWPKQPMLRPLKLPHRLYRPPRRDLGLARSHPQVSAMPTAGIRYGNRRHHAWRRRYRLCQRQASAMATAGIMPGDAGIGYANRRYRLWQPQASCLATQVSAIPTAGIMPGDAGIGYGKGRLRPGRRAPALPHGV